MLSVPRAQVQSLVGELKSHRHGGEKLRTESIQKVRLPNRIHTKQHLKFQVTDTDTAVILAASTGSENNSIIHFQVKVPLRALKTYKTS